MVTIAVAGNRRRYGGNLVHLGVALMALGIIGTRLFPAEATLTLAPSAPQSMGRYEWVFDELRTSSATTIARGRPLSRSIAATTT